MVVCQGGEKAWKRMFLLLGERESGERGGVMDKIRRVDLLLRQRCNHMKVNDIGGAKGFWMSRRDDLWVRGPQGRDTHRSAALCLLHVLGDIVTLCHGDQLAYHAIPLGIVLPALDRCSRGGSVCLSCTT